MKTAAFIKISALVAGVAASPLDILPPVSVGGGVGVGATASGGAGPLPTPPTPAPPAVPTPPVNPPALGNTICLTLPLVPPPTVGLPVGGVGGVPAAPTPTVVAGGGVGVGIKKRAGQAAQQGQNSQKAQAGIDILRSTVSQALSLIANIQGKAGGVVPPNDPTAIAGALPDITDQLTLLQNLLKGVTGGAGGVGIPGLPALGLPGFAEAIGLIGQLLAAVANLVALLTGRGFLNNLGGGNPLAGLLNTITALVLGLAGPIAGLLLAGVPGLPSLPGLPTLPGLPL